MDLHLDYIHFYFWTYIFYLDHFVARRSCPGRRGRWLAKLGYRSIKLSLLLSATRLNSLPPNALYLSIARARLQAAAHTRGGLGGAARWVCWECGPVYEHLSVRLRLLPGEYQQVAMKFAPSHMAMATLHRSNHLLLIFLNLVIVEPGWLLLLYNSYCLPT